MRQSGQKTNNSAKETAMCTPNKCLKITSRTLYSIAKTCDMFSFNKDGNRDPLTDSDKNNEYHVISRGC
jgi:hypothetical protein